MDSNKRILFAIAISAMILFGFNIFIPKPDSHVKDAPPAIATQTQPSISDEQSLQPKQEELSEARLQIEGRDVQGSFNLRGARLDDLVLNHYKESLAKDSPFVRLLEKAQSSHPNAVVIGWENTAGFKTILPNAATLWHSDHDRLTSSQNVTLSWDSPENVRFLIHLALDEHYVFTVTQEVENHSTQPLSLHPFIRIQRDYLPEDTGSFTEYEGPIAVMNGKLENDGYKNLRKAGDTPDNIAWEETARGGWAGITDKYWFTGVIASPHNMMIARYAYLPKLNSYRVILGAAQPQNIQPNATLAFESHVFVGAKVPSLLQSYAQKFDAVDFDKSIDFGWFSFITRPILYLLHWLYVHIGNFGLALMALTLIVKIILFPLASKAATSAARMRLVAPKMQEIREKFKNDPMVMNQKIMALYREEKINPAGGCLPMLIQAPIFFCLYKMLNISIDERHAPFFGWIKDLSVPDPTNLFNLFGLLPFEPTHIFSFLHLSIWGCALGITFWFLQKQSTITMDPAQARMMQFMPLVYVFVMSSFPAGLLVYYTWNNILTFLQQLYIQRRTTLPVPVKIINQKK